MQIAHFVHNNGKGEYLVLLDGSDATRADAEEEYGEPSYQLVTLFEFDAGPAIGANGRAGSWDTLPFGITLERR